MKKGVSAVIATILMLIITLALAGMAWLYITDYFGAFSKPVEIDCRLLQERLNYDYCEYDYHYEECCCYYRLYNYTYALVGCFEIEEK